MRAMPGTGHPRGALGQGLSAGLCGRGLTETLPAASALSQWALRVLGATAGLEEAKAFTGLCRSSRSSSGHVWG